MNDKATNVEAALRAPEPGLADDEFSVSVLARLVRPLAATTLAILVIVMAPGLPFHVRFADRERRCRGIR
jgi:hypothetical protein